MDDLSFLGRILNLDWATITGLVTVIVMLTAFVKDTFKVSGKWIYAVNGGLAIILNILTYAPQVKPIIAGSLACFLLAAGGWAGVKQIAHKVGTPPTQPNGGSK
ncbi:MAG: hypothetical protein WC356_05085 [Candidatus Micrarchaeia archaeon]|jgi:phage-related minor tail protein